MMYGKQREKLEKEYKNFYLTDFDFNKGTKHYRHLTNGRSINQPLVHIEDLWKIAFLDIFREISSEYFNDKSKLGFVKVRRFFSNNLPLYDTNYFHYDDNSKELLKAITELGDSCSVSPALIGRDTGKSLYSEEVNSSSFLKK